MISQGIVDEIVRLLAEGRLSQRTISRAVGVSRGTIGAIAKGHRPRIRRTEDRWGDPHRPLGPPRRCAGCGGLVFMPCLLCRVRTIRAGESAGD
ncbi:MAG TPA: hypothetical protein VHX65_15905 [Pirellulales bacterium]|jgi:hypothetical protein|nr:hypothetical protein [Pirellulales bacterium]